MDTETRRINKLYPFLGRSQAVPRHRSKGRWSVEQRLEFIDFRLYWEGHVNRSDLVDHFGISVPQASADLANYRAIARGNAVYDKTRKKYVASSRFKPVFFDPSGDEYLAQLRLIQSGLLTEDEAWAVALPSYSIVPILRRRLKPEILRRILNAIRTSESVQIVYQSMSSSEPKSRQISPHALAFDGFRWHTRAWCHSRERFLDFVLGRFLEVTAGEPSNVDPTDDIGWHREVTLTLAPHPAMIGGERRAIELDYGMENGAVQVTMRACMAYYFMRQLGLDSNPSDATPGRQHLVLNNKAEIESAMRETGVCEVSGDDLVEQSAN